MLSYDVRNLPDSSREAMALEVQKMKDFKLPRLRMWNYELCRKHRHGWTDLVYDKELDKDIEVQVTNRPKPGCRECGIRFRQHQRVSIAWIYLRKRGLLADVPGSGKTTTAGGLIAMMHETGEIPELGRVIIVPRSPALMQWYRELLRMMPSLNVVVALGARKKRLQLYSQAWDVLIISPQTLLNDYEQLEKHKLAAFITDDVDALRNRDTTTAYVLKRLGKKAPRMLVMTGTPLQKKLMELYSTLEPLGGAQAFGGPDAFEKRHVTKKSVPEVDARTGITIGYKTVTAYRGLAEVKKRMAPMVMRRNSEDFGNDVNMPTLMPPNDILLDLYPAQRNKYDALRKGVLKIMRETGNETKFVTALTAIGYGQKICGGLSVLGEADGPGTSVKMDWIERAMQEEFEEEKVVIFANYKDGVRSLQERFRKIGIGFETVWGEEKSKLAREASQERFWQDDKCRVLIGTQAIEQSLNLQVSRNLVNLDMIMNPARMEQLAGRIRREGSAYKHVFVHNLLTVNTQEERYLPLLEREAALAAHMWDENSELFQALDPMMMMQLITG